MVFLYNDIVGIELNDFVKILNHNGLVLFKLIRIMHKTMFFEKKNYMIIYNTLGTLSFLIVVLNTILLHIITSFSNKFRSNFSHNKVSS